MAEPGRRAPATITSASRPALLSHVKLRHDQARDRWVLLAPERVFSPNDAAIAALKLCNGARSVTDIAETLSHEYDASAAAIEADIIPMLQDLADKGVLGA